MHDPRATAANLETYVKSGFGEEAESVELDCLAVATCFDKTNDEHKEHARLAKKALKKHASAPVLTALSRITRRNYFPKGEPFGSIPQSTFDKDVARLDDFDALALIQGFDHIVFAARLVALAPAVLACLLARRDLVFLEDYFAHGHPRDTLTVEDVAHPCGRDYSHTFARDEVAVLARIGRFTSIEIEVSGSSYPLPDDLSAWSRLEFLSITARNVSSISQRRLDTIGALPALGHLRLDMRIGALPKDLSSLARLDTLDLSNNGFERLPTSLSTLGALRRLVLFGCRALETLPAAIGSLTSLEEIDLRWTGLTSCSPRLAELENLRTLELAKLPDPTGVYACLGGLKGLERLTISNMGDRTTPNVGALESLRSLVIYNDWGDFDEGFTGFERLTRLEELRLHRFSWNGDTAKRIVESIGRLEHLEVLDLENTYIDGHFPDGITRCSGLRRLVLQKSYAGQLPEDIGKLENLEVLDLRSAQLERYPDSLFTLKKLEELSIGDRIDPQPNLPEALGGLESLERLNLWRAGMTALPDSIVELEALERLELYANPLTTLPADFERLTNLVRVSGLPRGVDSLERRLDALRELMPWCEFEYF